MCVSMFALSSSQIMDLFILIVSGKKERKRTLYFTEKKNDREKGRDNTIHQMLIICFNGKKEKRGGKKQ